ncbi:ABC transporter ATP-binding protein [Clostridium sp.]|uniref:ABC transporter ATP-binding protein n=1 Tax=Clostridium sp. TaxID=1506 RepID=UPI00284E50A4|nr:ABC transporter ATP-binding protein [Clostridium sp.]MDR3596026.1 ABC transporter ATP-binding protein [Clostridium sp.]
MSDFIVKMDDINLNFGNKIVFENMSVCIPQNKIIGLVGKNGSGKTTFIRIVCRQIMPRSGICKVLEHDINKIGNYLNKKISIMSDGNRNLYWNLSGYDNLRYFAVLKGLDINIKERIDTLVENFSMENYIHKKVQTYSKGMKQKLMFSISLLNFPDLIILDEPVDGLDAENKILFKENLLQLVNYYNTSIIITSHDSNFLNEVCNEKYQIVNHKVQKLNHQKKLDKDINVYLEAINDISLLKEYYSDYTIIEDKKNILRIKENLNNVSFYNKIQELLNRNLAKVISISECNEMENYK